MPVKRAVPGQSVATLAAFAMLALAATIAAAEHAAAAAGSHVESVTIAKYANSSAAVDALLAGEIDMYYDSITDAEVQRVNEAGHGTYESSGGTTYSIYVNPVDDFTNGFNPFSQQGARYALNYVVDRSRIVDDLLMGSGAEMLSALPPDHYDYPLIYKEVESLGFSHDLGEADRRFTEALVPVGAQKVDGAWHHGGQPVVIKMFIRSDDPVRLQFGERLATDLQSVGFGVQKSYGSLLEAGSRVYSSDPAEQQWHIYTEGWGNSRTVKYDNLFMSIFYAPLFGNLPGEGEEHAWNYQNDLLDRLAVYLYFELYGSQEERAELLSAINRVGVTESVRIFLAAEHESYPVRANTTGVVNAPGYGITSRYTPLNVQLPGGDPSLSIGTNHVVQSSWNPVGGFTDVYSNNVWSLLRDRDHVRNPHNADLLDSRNVLVSVETGGPDGRLDVPSGAMIWDPEEHAWSAVGPGKQAISKVVFDLRLGDWHHGVPMDINDVLFPITFNIEHHTMHNHEEILDSDPHATLYSSGRLVAVEVIDGDTIGLYVNYWHFDEDEIVAKAGIWPFLPWEMYQAMDQTVHAGEADWYASVARAHSGNWLDMLDADDVALVRGHMSDLRNAGSGGIPDFLYDARDAAYVNARYDAAMSWMDDKKHAVISNGPFYLSNLIERDADGTITSMVLKQFDDPSYPFGAGHWSAFADFEPLSGDVAIGSLAPVTGNAYRYGEETRAASDLAVSHFNEYLDQRGEKWSIKTIHIDTETDPAAALAGLVALDRQNVKLVNGPVIDIITQSVLDYANANDMVLVSCCSSSPANAIPGDALFRMLPDQRVHAAEIVRLMTAHPDIDLKHVVPVGIDNPWATELLGAAGGGFEAGGVTFSEVITYDVNYVQGGGFVAGAEMAAAAEALADEVRRAAGQSGASNVAVLYVGFGEGPLFLKAAASHDVLDDVRWFGADQNTASPNISDDPESAAFASAVSFTAVQPSVPDNFLTGEVREHLAEISIEPSPYSSYAYDAVWVLGLAILDAQSSDPADVIRHIKPAAMRHVGAIGSTELNENGDLESGIYQAWLFSEDGQWSRYYIDPPGAEPSSKRTCR